jgi:hypothetical protein
VTPAAPVPEILRRATWIWAEHYGWDLVNCYADFRKTVELGRVPATAPLFITADQSYRLWINGKFVCRGPARGFQASWPYDEVDVARFLRLGANLIAVRAHNPGFSNYQYRSQGVAGLLVAGKWGKTEVLSDHTWKARRERGINRGAPPVSFQLFGQEHFDARVEPADWRSPGYDDSAWGAGSDCRAWNSMPWSGLEPRGIPMLAERVVRPAALLGAAAGRSAPGYASARDVIEVRVREPLGHAPAPGKPDDIKLPRTGRGRFRSYLVDFGKLHVGNLSVRVDGAAGGEIVDFAHVESIDHASLSPHLPYPAGCRMAFGNRLVCRKGTTGHDFYHPFGFRYLVLTVRDAVAPLRVRFHLNWVGYPLERLGRFKSSDPVLEAIWETSAWTQQCCMLDAYVDTPWREQAQWWGDARVQAWNTFHLSGDTRLLRRGIAQIASQTTPDGLTYGHAPTMAHHCILPDFTLIWILTLWDHYWQTGSVEAFRSHAETVVRAFEYFLDATDRKTGLVPYDPRTWLFLDWTGLFKDGCSAVYNLWLLIALDRAAALAVKAGLRELAGALTAWGSDLRWALRRLLDAQGLVRDGIRRDGTFVDSTSIHAQTLAIMAGLNPASEKAMLDKVLLPFVRGQENPDVRPSAYWITYVFEVLADRGYGPEVVQCIRERWAPMVAHGTTFEGFERDHTPGQTSLSHAWSAHPIFHLARVIGGIWQTAPAWGAIAFVPQFIGESGGATVPTPHGAIASAWERRGNEVRVSLSLPRGVKAEVQLPGLAPATVTGTRRWVVQCRP